MERRVFSLLALAAAARSQPTQLAATAAWLQVDRAGAGTPSGDVRGLAFTSDGGSLLSAGTLYHSEFGGAGSCAPGAFCWSSSTTTSTSTDFEFTPNASTGGNVAYVRLVRRGGAGRGATSLKDAPRLAVATPPRRGDAALLCTLRLCARGWAARAVCGRVLWPRCRRTQDRTRR